MPESERAKDGAVWVSCAACNRNHKFGQCSQPAPAKEPTLTCSEVVERLDKECFLSANPNPVATISLGVFDRSHAEKILTEWRERRVQELEAFKKYVHDRLDAMGVPHSDPESEHDKAGCRIGGRLDIVENALANSEQIRKGAKHED